MNLHKMEKYLQHIHHLQKVIFTAYRLGLWNQRKGKQQPITVYSVHCCSLRILFDMSDTVGGKQTDNIPPHHTTSHDTHAYAGGESCGRFCLWSYQISFSKTAQASSSAVQAVLDITK